MQPLASGNVGVSPAGGTAVLTSGVAYDVTAGGEDISGTADEFRYVYRQQTGDFDVKVQIAGIAGSQASAKAGLMARDGLTAGGRHVSALATKSSSYRFLRRTAAGGTTAATSVSAVSPPNTWVRLRRVGNTFTTFYGTNGSTWTQMGSVTVSLPSTINLGMAATPDVAGASATAQFRNFGPANAAVARGADGRCRRRRTGRRGSRSRGRGGAGDALPHPANGPGRDGVRRLGDDDGDDVHRQRPRRRHDLRLPRARRERRRASAYAGPVSATTYPPASTRPAVPTNVAATATSSSQINVTWTASAAAELYRVQPHGPERRGVRHRRHDDDGELRRRRPARQHDLPLPGAGGKRRGVVLQHAGGVGDDAGGGLKRWPAPTSSAPAGRTTVVGAGAYDVVAGGNDIDDNADAFRLDARRLTGDFDVRVQVTSLDRIAARTKAGLMARESLDAGSRNVFVGATSGEGWRMSRRATTNGDSPHSYKAGSVAFPNAWVRLRRVGNTFTGFYSTNGTSWTQMSQFSLSLPSTVYVGLATAAMSGNTATTTATYRNLTGL